MALYYAAMQAVGAAFEALGGVTKVGSAILLGLEFLVAGRHHPLDRRLAFVEERGGAWPDRADANRAQRRPAGGARRPLAVAPA